MGGFTTHYAESGSNSDPFFLPSPLNAVRPGYRGWAADRCGVALMGLKMTFLLSLSHYTSCLNLALKSQGLSASLTRQCAAFSTVKVHKGHFNQRYGDKIILGEDHVPCRLLLYALTPEYRHSKGNRGGHIL